jgi:hypothetical protein
MPDVVESVFNPAQLEESILEVANHISDLQFGGRSLYSGYAVLLNKRRNGISLRALGLS